MQTIRCVISVGLVAVAATDVVARADDGASLLRHISDSSTTLRQFNDNTGYVVNCEPPFTAYSSSSLGFRLEGSILETAGGREGRWEWECQPHTQ